MVSLGNYNSANLASDFSRPILYAKDEITVNTDSYSYYDFINKNNGKLHIIVYNRHSSHNVVLEIRAHPERATTAPAYSTSTDLKNWITIEQPDGSFEYEIESQTYYNETLTDYYPWILIGLKRKTSGNSADVKIWRNSGP